MTCAGAASDHRPARPGPLAGKPRAACASTCSSTLTACAPAYSSARERLAADIKSLSDFQD